MDSLFSRLTNLQLQPTASLTETKRFNAFTLFPALPIELRLKILSHALPACATLRLNAHIHVADPSFGLYLTFATTSPDSVSIFTSNAASTPSLSATRQSNLLLVNKEFRDHYLEKFPLHLPTGDRGAGKIRFAQCETILLANLEELTKERDFALALTGNWRLQTWWDELELLAVPIMALISGRLSNRLRPATIMSRFGRLKELKVHMWAGFDDQVADDEAARIAVKKSMESHLRDLRRELDLLEYGEEYLVPKIVLV